jgi:phosphoribosylglycinamide formyltransferase-1
MGKLNVGLFASGGGSNLQSIIDQSQAGNLDAVVSVVISNNSKSGALERARNHNIAGYHISGKTHPDPKAYVAAIQEALSKHEVKLIALAGYMKLLPPEVIREYANRIVNIHPALLPSFGGKGMYGHHVHEAVLASGCKVSGVTVHIVNEQYDEGPIVAQRCVKIAEGDTPETLAARVLIEEHRIYPDAIQLFAQDRIKVIDRKVNIS